MKAKYMQGGVKTFWVEKEKNGVHKREIHGYIPQQVFSSSSSGDDAAFSFFSRQEQKQQLALSWIEANRRFLRAQRPLFIMLFLGEGGEKEEERKKENGAGMLAG